MAGFTQQQLNQAGVGNMYTPPSFQPPTQQYQIPGTNDFTTNPAILKQDQSGANNNLAFPGLAPDSPYNNPSRMNSSGTSSPGTYQGWSSETGQTPAQQQPPQQTQSYSPQVGTPSLQNNPQQQNVAPIDNIQTPANDQIGQKYQQTYQNLQTNGGKALVSSGQARVAVSQAAPPTPSQPYQPSSTFMTVGDPIMQQFMQAALQTSNDVTNTGYTAKAIQQQFGAQVQSIDLQALNMQNIINGTRNDIRSEISKAGGFATESQIEALTTTRNRDLLINYNNLELQKQALTAQMNTQVNLAQMDHQFAVDKYNNVMKAGDLYRSVYNNTTTQVDQLINRVGYSGLAAAYNNDPYALSLAEQHLGMPSGTLTNPASLSSLETYREKTLNLSTSRFGAQYGYNPDQSAPTQAPTSANASYSSGNPTSNLPGGGAHLETNPNVPYAQYGLLSHTNFDPSSQGDKNALNYLNTYLNGKMPQGAGDIGISIRGSVGSQQYQSAVSRANDLYFAATGQNLPNPDLIKSNMDIIGANNKLANNLKIQESTVNANFGLSLQNLNANNLNSAWPILNNTINAMKNAEGDPAVAQYITQNSTIQQELGNLLAVKNAAGTTVHDKIAGAGLMPSNATPEQQVAIVKTLLQEAKNASNAFSQANASLYQQTDPLERQTGNPNRQNTLNTPSSSDVLMTSADGSKKYYVSADKVNVMKQHGYK